MGYCVGTPMSNSRPKKSKIGVISSRLTQSVAAVATYRLYFLLENGHIRGVIELNCEDDDAAKAAAEEHRGPPMELWNLDRQVEIYPAIT